jgi:hypothetical protein
MQAIALLTLTRTAGAALTAQRFVAPDGTVPAAGANTLGVTRTDAAAGSPVAVDAIGTAIVEAAAAIADGAPIETTVDGRAVTKTTGISVARALQAAGAAGDKIEVLLIPN